MVKPYKEEKINFSLLDLDKNNPRFLMLYKDSKEEDDIIEYLLTSENAIDVVKSIISHKDYFDDSFCYVIKNGERYIVREGNRRLAALKALANPEKYLKNKYSQFLIDKIPCLVYEDEKKLSEKIVARHTQVEVQRWSRLAQGAYIQTHLDNGGKLSDFNYLKDYKNVYKLFKFWEAGSKFEGYHNLLINLLIKWERASIIERFFGRNDLLKKMGFEFNDDSSIFIHDEQVFVNSLNCFLKWLAPSNKDIKTQKINKNTIDDYFKEAFSDNGYEDPQLNLLENAVSIENTNTDKNEIDSENIQEVEGVVNNSNNETSTNTSTNSEKTSEDVNDILEEANDTCLENDQEELYEENIQKHHKKRKTLVPKTLSNIVLNEYTKTHNLFDELQNIDVFKNPTCCALGFRAFIEYSCKIYMEKIREKDINKNEDSNLSANICSIVGDLLKNGLISKGLNQYINRRYKDKICPLNDIVHGTSYPINSTQLCMDWDAYQNLFIPIWNEISNIPNGGV